MIAAAPPDWVGAYVGLPFVERGRDPAVGLDCYGLARAVLATEHGVELPMFALDGQQADKAAQAAAIVSRRSEGAWTCVQRGAERVFDVAEIEETYLSATGSWKSAALHMGIVVAPGWMLHTRRDTGARLDRYDRPPWARRVPWFWRHQPASAGLAPGGATGIPARRSGGAHALSTEGG